MSLFEQTTRRWCLISTTKGVFAHAHFSGWQSVPSFGQTETFCLFGQCVFFSLTSAPLDGDALSLCFSHSEDHATDAAQDQRGARNCASASVPWFPELVELLTAPPWPILLWRDLLSEAKGTVWNSRPELWDEARRVSALF